MMANVLITVGNNGTDVPNEVIEAINAIMRSGISDAHAEMTVDGVNYAIDYHVIIPPTKAKEVDE